MLKKRDLVQTLNFFPHLVWASDASGNSQIFNRRLTEYIGAAGPRWQDFVHPDDQVWVFSAWTTAQEAGQPFVLDHRLRDKNGGYRWFRHTAEPFGDPDPGEGWLGTCIDISEIKQAEDELKQSDRAKSQFLAILSHELRNPLQPLTMMAYTLETSTDPEQVREARGVISRQVAQIGRIIDDLLDVSHVDSGKVVLHPVVLDVNTCVDRAVEAIRPMLESRNHKIHVWRHQGAMFIHADPARIEQVLVNLLTNAAKYTDVRGQIGVRIVRDGDQVKISVFDNGIGIAKEMIDKIFNPFMQVERRIDRPQDGMGLGLFLVKKLTELNGGTIGVESRGVSHGSLFTLRFPLTDCPFTPDPVPVIQRTRSPRHILVVDDNKDAAQAFQMIMELQGHRVDVAFDGPDGLLKMREVRPDTVFLDIGLPDMDGYEVARQIRADQEFKGVLLIALTGYGQKNDQDLSREAGFDHHLVKPANPASIEALLQSHPV